MRKSNARKHEQVTLTLFNDFTVRVDCGVHELIAIMNAPGIRTLNSCQEDQGTGYVQFRGRLAKPFMYSVLRQWLNAKGAKPLAGITFVNPNNRDFPGSFSIRWDPLDFERLVRYARAAIIEIAL